MSRSQPSLRVRAYIDGLNLYYGCLKGTPYRWLNVAALVRGLLDPLFADYSLEHIRYFTANIKSEPGNPEAANRQKEYLRALASLGPALLSIHHGRFLTHQRRYRLADGTGHANVLCPEEKGSDVNLASHLLMDAFDQRYDVALVVSNDSDLVPPIRMLRDRFPVRVAVAAPCSIKRRRPSHALASAASLTAPITRERRDLLRESQFPEVVELGAGKRAFRPRRWAPG